MFNQLSLHTTYNLDDYDPESRSGEIYIGTSFCYHLVDSTYDNSSEARIEVGLIPSSPSSSTSRTITRLDNRITLWEVNLYASVVSSETYQKQGLEAALEKVDAYVILRELYEKGVSDGMDHPYEFTHGREERSGREVFTVYHMGEDGYAMEVKAPCTREELLLMLKETREEVLRILRHYLE